MDESSSYHDAPFEAQKRIDRVCDRFEAAVKAGKSPQIEDYLRELSRDHGSALFRALLALELEYLREHGEGTQPADYEFRFPQYGTIVRKLCAKGDDLDQVADAGPGAMRRGLHIHCPHCRNPVELVEEIPLVEIVCPSCGSSFNLAEPSTAAYEDGRATTLGHFQLIEELGSGAFGTVWKARDLELDRMVAVKIPRTHQLSGEETEQFLREARSAAQLRHPNIVSVHEVGRHQDTVYIVSDYVEGVTLADWLSSGKRISFRESAELCSKLAETLHHAHEAGVVHRDLKPSNTMLDGKGEPFILDFGLAKREASEITMTLDGRVLGTPAYMSPEQAKGEAHLADRRSDVYSLGVILFELLTGEMPFRGSARMLIYQVINDEAPSPRKLNGNIPRDLETICLRCLEKDRAKRYDTAEELGEELHRVLRREPIRARRITRISRGWRWCQRNPLVAALLVLVLLTLSLGALGTSVGFIWAEQKRREATQAALRSQRLTVEADAKRVQTERQLRVVTAQRLATQGLLDSGAFPERSALLAVSAVDATSRYGEPTLPLARQTLIHVLQNVGGLPFSSASDIGAYAVSTDRRLFAGSTESGSIVVWDLQAENPTKPRLLLPRRLQDARPWPIDVIQFSPNGRWLVAGGKDCPLCVWDVASGVPSPEGVVLSDHYGADLLAICPQSRWVAARTAPVTEMERRPLRDDLELRLWDLRSEEPAASGFVIAHRNDLLDENEPVDSIEFSPDGRWLVTTSAWGGPCKVRLVDVAEHPAASSVAVLGEFDGAITRFTPDSRWLVTGEDMRTRELWNLTDTTRVRVQLKTGPDFRFDKDADAISPDGHWLFTGDYRGAILRWDLSLDAPNERFVQLRRNADGPIGRVLVSPDGRWLVVDGAPIELLDLAAKDRDAKAYHLETKASNAIMAISPDGRWLAVGHYDGTISLWDLSVPCPDIAGRAEYIAHATVIRQLAFSPDSRWLVSTAEGDNTVGLRHLVHEDHEDPVFRDSRLRGHDIGVTDLIIEPNGRYLVTLDPRTGPTEAGYLPSARFWDLQAEAFTAIPQRLARGSIHCVGEHFGKDHTRQIVLDPYSELRRTAVWDLSRAWDLRSANRYLAPVFLRGAQSQRCLAISRDRTRLVTLDASESNLYVWELASDNPEAIRTGSRHIGKSEMWFVELSRDGRWLLTAESDVILLYDLESAELSPRVLQRSSDNPMSPAAFTPDGLRLITGNHRGTASIWELAENNLGGSPLIIDRPETESQKTQRNGRPLSEGERDQMTNVIMSPDGQWLVVIENTEWVTHTRTRLWRLAENHPPSFSGDLLPGMASSWPSIIRFSASSRYLVIGWANLGACGAYLWDLRASEHPRRIELLELRGSSDVDSDQDSDRYFVRAAMDTVERRLAMIDAYSPTVWVWDLGAKDVTASLIKLHRDTASRGADLAVSPDGRWLASSSDFTTHIWDLASEHPQETLVRLSHESKVQLVEVSPNGRSLLTVDIGNILWWPLDVDTLTSLARQTAGRALSAAETRQFRPGDRIEVPISIKGKR